MYRACEIGGTQGPLEYVNARGATRLVHWLILVRASDLHNARATILNPFNKRLTLVRLVIWDAISLIMTSL